MSIAQSTAGWKSKGNGRNRSFQNDSEVLRPLKSLSDCVNDCLAGTVSEGRGVLCGSCNGLFSSEADGLSLEVGRLIDAFLDDSSYLWDLEGSKSGRG